MDLSLGKRGRGRNGPSGAALSGRFLKEQGRNRPPYNAALDPGVGALGAAGRLVMSDEEKDEDHGDHEHTERDRCPGPGPP